MESNTGFSIDFIKQLVSVAVENRLSLLQVSDVKIVPGPQSFGPQPDLKILEEAKVRKGKSLDQEEIRDTILFGPGAGFIKDDN